MLYCPWYTRSCMMIVQHNRKCFAKLKSIHTSLRVFVVVACIAISGVDCDSCFCQLSSTANLIVSDLF